MNVSPENMFRYKFSRTAVSNFINKFQTLTYVVSALLGLDIKLKMLECEPVTK